MSEETKRKIVTLVHEFSAGPLLYGTTGDLFDAILALVAEERSAMREAAAQVVFGRCHIEGCSCLNGLGAAGRTELANQIRALDPNARPTAQHDYISTACFHGKHDRCRKNCKFCSTACACGCHKGETVAVPTAQPVPTAMKRAAIEAVVNDWIGDAVDCTPMVDSLMEIAMSGGPTAQDREREIRLAALDEARTAYLSHTFTTIASADPDVCGECGENFRSALHLRANQNRSSRIAELEAASSQKEPGR